MYVFQFSSCSCALILWNTPPSPESSSIGDAHSPHNASYGRIFQIPYAIHTGTAGELMVTGAKSKTDQLPRFGPNGPGYDYSM
jgi:hypothetical protein